MYRYYGTGEYATGEQHYAAVKRDGNVKNRRIVYYGHGALNFAASLGTVEQKSLAPVVEYAGFPVICGDELGSPGGYAAWGNDSSVAKRPALRSFAEALWPDADHDLPLGWGTSMGGLLTLNIEKANPGTFAAIVMANPVLDPQDVYDANRGGFTASISTAHGGRPTDARTPARNAAAFADVPILIFQSDDDPICLPSIAETFADDSGAELVSIGATGHEITNIPGEQVAEFLYEHGAS